MPKTLMYFEVGRHDAATLGNRPAVLFDWRRWIADYTRNEGKDSAEYIMRNERHAD